METIPTITPVAETPDEIRLGNVDNPDPNNAPDANDSAIYLHPENPAQSFVITTFKNGGLRVYDLAGKEIQSITPENIRYNNVEIAYGVEYQSQIVGETATVDLAIASDGANDTLAIWAINPNGGGGENGLPASGILTEVTSFNIPESIFGIDDGETTAYGLATYTSPVDGKTYVFVSQSGGNKIAQLELKPGLGAADGLEVGGSVVRTLEVPVPEGEDPAEYQAEGMVVDRETGDLYVGQEDFGIWKYNAEPNDRTEPKLVDTVTEDIDLSQVPYSNLVVFGDSLSDRGNVFNATEGLIPPPPYSEGRFSNGDLIIDAIADHLELPQSESFLAGGSNYAFGGAQTGEGTSEFDLLGNLLGTFDVPNIGQQVDLYLSTQTPAATDLFYVYGGGNDFIDPLLRGEALPTSEEIIGNITTNITELAEAGAQTFVVPNLPALGDIPLFLEQPEATAILNNASDEFNQLLDTELDAIASELKVTIIEPDVNSISTEIQTNPTDFGLTNTTDAVLDLSNLGLTGNPEEFFYWDAFHPTATATEIIAQEVIDILPSGIAQFEEETPSLVPDVEGLTIYYGEDGNGYLLASSQGNNTFAIYDRAGSNSYLGSFAVEDVEESNGVDVINVPLGDNYPAGLLVVQDGSNEPAEVFPDPEDEEIQNFNTNFKFVSLADFEQAFSNLPPYDPNAYDPRNPEPRTLINGVASGDTTQDSTVLWARSNVLGNVTFEYATDVEFSNIVGTVDAEVTDTTIPVKVDITDLEAGTDYYYRVTDAAGDTEVGEFHTSTEIGTNTGLRFGVAGDWRGELTPYPVISNADERNLEFFVEHGDTIYADIGSDAVLNPDGTQKEQVETIEEYRAKHSEVYGNRLGSNTFADLRGSTSILATIDDHDVNNDFAGGDLAANDERFPETEGLINDTELFENSLQVFQEYNPLRDEFYGETGEEVTSKERKLYRFNTYGSDAATFILDSRSFRDPSLTPPEDINNSDEIGRVLTESITLDRTLLGETQLTDLKQDLLTADEADITWKFVMLPEPAQNLFPGLNTDSYEGYLNERAELLRFIEKNEIENVVFVAADIHMTSVNNLTYQTEPFGEQIPTSVFEVTTGAIALDRPTGEILGDTFTADNPELAAVYNSLPIAPDTDNLPNDKDDVVEQAINDTLLTPLGFDPIGLDNNLPQAEGLIDAELIQGDYYVGHTYGWTEFDIDPETQQLKVTTYAVDAYSEAEILADPNAINELEPVVVSEFLVNPQDDIKSNQGFAPIFGTLSADTLEITGTKNLVFAGEGNDTVNVSDGDNRIYGDGGNDALFLGTGDYVVGGEGSDQFWVADPELPDIANRIADFELGKDVIGFNNLSIGFEDLTLTQERDNTLIAVANANVAVLAGVDASNLSEDNFVFG